MRYITILILLFSIYACSAQSSKTEGNDQQFAIVKTEAEWKAQLTAEEYNILRDKGTERAWTGEYNKNYKEGEYKCKGCNTVLFTSDSKFDSGSGWPSFDAPINTENVITDSDNTFGMSRTEILCGACGGHLGHVFNDGPTKTGKRYCVNSLSLTFEPELKK
mgnify:CR=1 FL=1